MREAITMEILNNRVDLEDECWACGMDMYKDDKGRCEMCNGTGFTPTDTGRAILALMERHGVK